MKSNLVWLNFVFFLHLSKQKKQQLMFQLCDTVLLYVKYFCPSIKMSSKRALRVVWLQQSGSSLW